MYESLYNAFKVCSWLDQGDSKLALLKGALKYDESFNIDTLRKELLDALKDKNFNWVEAAVSNGFIQNIKAYERPLNLTSEILKVYSDKYSTFFRTNPDSYLTPKERDTFYHAIDAIDFEKTNSIIKVLDTPLISKLPFEFKHYLLNTFEEQIYFPEDIIFSFKSIAWNFLFPENIEKRKKRLSAKTNDLLHKHKLNQGWIESSAIINLLQDDFPGIDSYELSCIEFNNNIQYMRHFRNKIALGFYRSNYSTTLIG